jgi:pimeloyl-ACP methyl ester carboxylesterase
MHTVRSADGTDIAYDRSGGGPALVVCAGALSSRRSFAPPPKLTAAFTVYTYDRRGRGDSGDTPPYAPEREYEDLAAVIAATGERPFVFGHSSGAAITLRAAAAGVPMRAIVAYEAPFGNPAATVETGEHIRDLIGQGRRDDVVMFWLTDVMRAPDEVLAMVRRGAWLKGLAALSHTLPYDLAVTAGRTPAAELAAIEVSVLLLCGSNSREWFHQTAAEQAAAIPDARLATIDGYDHNAPPGVITPFLLEFFPTI